ncbi:MAG: short-chain dehydrogenase, partial [Luminiphilus sp.]|nr:short-chain dehydrogenase [Luminiphilus sp.]
NRRGLSDEVIDAGDDPLDCAKAILAAVKDDLPELIFAKEMELGLAHMRHADPEAFFDAVADFGAQTVSHYWTEKSALEGQ